MKRLAAWAGVCAGSVLLQMAITFWFLVPNIDDRAYVIRWWPGDAIEGATGWHALMPYYAWPILVTYLGALVVVAVVVAVAIACSILQRGRQVIARREAAVGLQEEQARTDTAKARHVMAEAERIRQSAKEEMTRFEQEATAQIEDADARMQGSVNTNIGRQRMIQKLRERVSELETENQELRKQVGGPEGKSAGRRRRK